MVRGAVLALVVVCGAALADPLPALERLPKLPAQLEVIVIERETGERVEGATVVVPRGRDAAAVAITDRSGQAILDAEEGPTEVSVYYADDTVEQRVVVTGTLVTLTVRVEPVPPPPDPCPASGGSATPREIAALATSLVAHAPEIPDGHFLTKPIVLESLPGVVGVRGAEVMAVDEIQQRADRTGRDQPFLAIDEIELGAGCAKVEARISIVRAKREGTLCCISDDVYRRRRDGKWVFAQTLGAACT